MNLIKKELNTFFENLTTIEFEYRFNQIFYLKYLQLFTFGYRFNQKCYHLI